MSKVVSRLHKKKKNQGLFHIIIGAILIILLINFLPMQESQASSKDIQEGIAGQIIRFHVIANSDQVNDQELKLKVKDKVVASMKEIFEKDKSKEEARKDIEKYMPKIEEIARKVIEENGYHYSVSVSLENTYFPTKVYGDMTFPPGVYEALRIQIGEADGKNWWCVMFPPLCFVDSTYSIVPDQSKNQLKRLLTLEEYNSLIGKEDVQVRIRFKLFDVFKNLF